MEYLSAERGGVVEWRSLEMEEEQPDDDWHRFEHARHCVPKRIVHEVSMWGQRQRQRTIGVGLVVCLNIGVDPPDVIKTAPCARLECWLDPFSLPPKKALASIGDRLQRQYEKLHSRALYKLCLDRNDEELKKMCHSLRKTAKQDRVLLHYNGHGVPRPTKNGEIWVFNKNFSQYIPVSVFDLHIWLQPPALYVFDASGAGVLVESFKRIAVEWAGVDHNMRDVIVLAACKADELLPMNPLYPADIFTSCLTTPIEMALRWFASKSLLCELKPDDVTLPGRHTDRRSPLGELNWIFTAITDTIAWNALPQPLFQRLFRQDLLVASLFRNFLLAERIMRSLNCTPVSMPELPPTFQHPMWEAWDLAAEFALSQLAKYRRNEDHVFERCSFFSDQLTAFEVWLEFSSQDSYPMQLPVVLQVLLSQSHRLRALHLLARFLDKGPKAVNQALSVGIFPYILKLRQSPTMESRNVIVFIWSKILALDKNCKVSLINDAMQKYFLSHLDQSYGDYFQCTLCCFIISILCDKNADGQRGILQSEALPLLSMQLQCPHPTVRRWAALAIGKLWENYREAQLFGYETEVPEVLIRLLSNPFVEVRAAAAYALGLLLTGYSEDPKKRFNDLLVAKELSVLILDGSVMVRVEMILALAQLILTEEEAFARIGELYYSYNTPDIHIEEDQKDQEYMCTDLRRHIIAVVLACRHDPYPHVSEAAQHIASQLNLSAAAEENLQRRIRTSVDDKVDRARQHPMRKVHSLSGLAPKKAKASSFDPLGGRRIIGDGLAREKMKNLRIFDIYKWNCEFFNNPLLNYDEENEKGEIDFLQGDLDMHYYGDFDMEISREVLLEEQIAKDRNAVTRSAAREMDDDSLCPLDAQLALIPTGFEETSMIKFHPFHDQLICVNYGHDIAVWTFEPVLLNKFSNETNRFYSRDSRITSMHVINPEYRSLLLCGSNDGLVRIWKNIDNCDKQRLLSAWIAVPGMNGGKPGMICDWQQMRGRMVAFGGSDTKVMLWDVEYEQSTEIATSIRSVTASASDDPGDIVYLGCTDGVIRTLDLRTNDNVAVSSPVHKYSGRVVDLSLQKKYGLVVSASIRGNVCVHDIRSLDEPLYSINAHPNTPLNAMATHDYAPVIATGSSKQFVNMMRTDGSLINRVKYNDTFLGTRIGPVHTLAFHPHKMVLGMGGGDSLISIHSIKSL